MPDVAGVDAGRVSTERMMSADDQKDAEKQAASRTNPRFTDRIGWV